jgi:hypothetical protein
MLLTFLSPLFLFSDLFSAGSAMAVLKENHFAALLIGAWNHKACSAGLAAVEYKGFLRAYGALHQKRSSTAGTKLVVF